MIVFAVFALILVANFIAAGEATSPLGRFMINLALSYCGYVLGSIAARDHYLKLFAQEKESPDGK